MGHYAAVICQHGVFTPQHLQRGNAHYNRAQICVSIMNNHLFCLSTCLWPPYELPSLKKKSTKMPPKVWKLKV